MYVRGALEIEEPLEVRVTAIIYVATPVGRALNKNIPLDMVEATGVVRIADELMEKSEKKALLVPPMDIVQRI